MPMCNEEGFDKRKGLIVRRVSPRGILVKLKPKVVQKINEVIFHCLIAIRFDGCLAYSARNSYKASPPPISGRVLVSFNPSLCKPASEELER